MADETPHRRDPLGPVVVLEDARWPRQPGVCCWRSNVTAVFTGLGLDVREVAWSPPAPVDVSAATSPVPARPRASLGRVALGFAKRAGWAGARAAGRVARRTARRAGLPRPRLPAGPVRGRAGAAGTTDVRTASGDPRLTSLADARLVIAEAPDAALAAVQAGVPSARVWLLAIPPERVGPGEPVTWAGDLRDAVPLIGGLVADSLDAAGVLERVAGPVRTVVLPPLAVDRACAGCATTVNGSVPNGRRHHPDGLPDVFPAGTPGHLLLWHDLLVDASSEGAATPTAYSYAVARLRGEAGPWIAPALERWGTDRTGPAFTTPTVTGEPPPAWTADAQRDGARALLAKLPTAFGVVAARDGGPRRVRVFGHDMKFMRELTGVLGGRGDLEVAVDEWSAAGVKNEGVTEQLARSAQTLVAEWVRPNAAWLSEVKRPDQRLVVRLHRFEIDSDYPRQVRIDAVDAVVYIAPHMGPRIRDELGWPVDKLVYVPNYVDLAHLDRPKYADARFNLGMVGIVPTLKRFDLALDLLAAVRREDPRFSLLVRSQSGWAHKPSWERPAERREVQRSYERIEKDPLLRGAVVFDAFGRDMAAWYRKVGHILSLSDVEGSHASLSEGMASGAVPVVRGWAGAVEAYGEQGVCDALPDAVTRVLDDADHETWQRRSAQAKRDVAARFDPGQVVEAWVDLVHGRVEDARRRFAPFTTLRSRD